VTAKVTELGVISPLQAAGRLSITFGFGTHGMQPSLSDEFRREKGSRCDVLRGELGVITCLCSVMEKFLLSRY
jgi:hypothetical protein